MAKADNTIGVDKVSVTRFDRGGAKKTTAAINLAVGLSLQGQRTIIPDMDPQRSEFVTPSGFDTYIIDAPPSFSPLSEEDRSR
jgi:MinD-like ATPase involved in chromosome partitioning or flagellar assembly